MFKKMLMLVCVLVLMYGGISNANAMTEAEIYKTKKYAELGNVDAQYNLGRMYLLGLGVAQDFSKAATWYRLAADQGDADAQLHLGLMYAEGKGVAQDFGDAARWIRKSAEQGLPGAQYNLGVLYGKGEGVPQDYLQSLMFFIISADGGNIKARHVRNLVAKEMTPEQIAEAQKLAREWMAKYNQ